MVSRPQKRTQNATNTKIAGEHANELGEDDVARAPGKENGGAGKVGSEVQRRFPVRRRGGVREPRPFTRGGVGEPCPLTHNGSRPQEDFVTDAEQGTNQRRIPNSERHDPGLEVPLRGAGDGNRDDSGNQQRK